MERLAGNCGAFFSYWLSRGVCPGESVAHVRYGVCNIDQQLTSVKPELFKVCAVDLVFETASLFVDVENLAKSTLIRLLPASVANCVPDSCRNPQIRTQYVNVLSRKLRVVFGRGLESINQWAESF